MRNICTVNMQLPTIDDEIEYLSSRSLLDYDIVVFDPGFPYLSRIQFSGGGSCIAIEDSQRLKEVMGHWSSEIKAALSAGKTVFVILNSLETDALAAGYSTGARNTRTYNTFSANNYSVLPISIDVRNATGRRMKVVDAAYRALHDSLKERTLYKVVIHSPVDQKTFVTNDGSGVLGGVIAVKGLPGHLVLLPHFDLSDMVKDGEDGEIWTNEALTSSKRIVSQLVAIDAHLRSGAEGTPQPEWVGTVQVPIVIGSINNNVAAINDSIAELEVKKSRQNEEKKSLLKYTALLYENGRNLESVIEATLRLIGYEVSNFRNGDVEIDHVIVGPSGLRMIGESEGKDNSAIDISKFRQLETNINEDFARDDVLEPAKGILFGNGYRLMQPEKRQNEFTSKCLVNAKRLGTALVKTTDLYAVAVHLLDNPQDDEFKAKCREVIESTSGDIVKFPSPFLPSKGKRKKVSVQEG